MNCSKNYRVLAIGNQDVYPPVDGGKEGVYGALSALAKYTHVSYAFPNKGMLSHINGYEKIGVKDYPINILPNESIACIVKATFLLKPFKFEKYCTWRAVNALDLCIGSNEFDVIICHQPHVVKLAERLKELRRWKIPIILREHNIEYELVRSYGRSLDVSKQLLAAFYAELTKREEQSIWKRVQAVSFLSDADLRFAHNTRVAGRYELVREGIPLPPRRPIRPPPASAPLLLLLNPTAIQSIANVREFIKMFWIPLHESGLLTGNSLNVTGVTSTELANMVGCEPSKLSDNGVKGLGFLPSLAQVLEESLALISPTFIGGGVRKKILEAMANQLPVIATQLDISSCDFFEVNKNILPMSTHEQFLESVNALKASDEIWCDISNNARDVVEKYASWEIYGKSVYDMIVNLVNQKDPS